MQNTEIEFRSIVSEDKYRALLEFLSTNANDLGENDKHTYHFIFPDKLLNVIDQTSKGTAKIALKLGKIGEGSAFGEIEVTIDQKEFEKTVHLFKSLGFGEIIESFQTRHDFEYKGVELAVKHSEQWGYHVELEIVLPQGADTAEAEQKIRDVAKELDIQLMTEEELKALVDKIESEHRARKLP
jgi:predicted adenylyl cyclase CyaB